MRCLTLGANGTTYTAPADGWFNLSSLNATMLQLYNESAGKLFVCSVSPSAQALGICIPAKMGDVIRVYYSFGSVRWFRFIYAQGSK